MTRNGKVACGIPRHGLASKGTPLRSIGIGGTRKRAPTSLGNQLGLGPNGAYLLDFDVICPAGLAFNLTLRLLGTVQAHDFEYEVTPFVFSATKKYKSWSFGIVCWSTSGPNSDMACVAAFSSVIDVDRFVWIFWRC